MTDDFSPRSRVDWAWRTQVATARAEAGPAGPGRQWTSTERKDFLASLGADEPAGDGPAVFSELSRAEKDLVAAEADFSQADTEYRAVYHRHSHTDEGRERTISRSGWSEIHPLQRARDQLSDELDAARRRRNRLLAEVDELDALARGEHRGGW